MNIKDEVKNLLSKDTTGHGMDHVDRVLRLSLWFAEKEKADKDITSIIALLHDVDDYKLYGNNYADNLINARRILNECNIDEDIQKIVLLELSRIGYSKRLKGLAPETIEGKVVSDADMCDGLGATGILRTHAYNVHCGRPFFDKETFPIENISAEEYMNNYPSSSVCHMFEKILKLKDLMLTNSGKEEAVKRHKIVVDFLYNLFREEDAVEWIEYLDNYQKKLMR